MKRTRSSVRALHSVRRQMLPTCSSQPLLAAKCESVEALDVSADAVEHITANAVANGITNLTAREANVFDELVSDGKGPLADRQKMAIARLDQELSHKFDPQKLDKALKILKLGL